MMAEQVLGELAAAFKGLRMAMMRPGADVAAALENQIQLKRRQIETGTRAGNLSADARHIAKSTITALERALGDDPAKALKQTIEERRNNLKEDAAKAGGKLETMFRFCEEAFGDGQEIQILVTELTISHHGAGFISRYGCDAYYAHNQGLLLNDRKKELLAEIDELTMPLV